MQIDLAKVSAVLQSLATDQGKQIVQELYDQLQQFRAQLNPALNDAEFRHMMQTLFSQQVVSETPPAKITMVDIGRGFQIREAAVAGDQI